MRQIFSVRFFAAVGAVALLLFGLTTVLAARETIEDADEGPTRRTHLIDYVDKVFGPTNLQFSVDADGLAASDTDLVIDGARRMRIVAGTPGEIHCPDLDEVGACAIVADLLGEAVVWFALVPMGAGRTVHLPAVESIEGDVATLVNGWQVRYAPVLDRICETGYESFREFREGQGAMFTSVFDIDQRRLTSVDCGSTVDYVTTLAQS